jgi:5-dehydro-2-deoxygluconokinase
VLTLPLPPPRAPSASLGRIARLVVDAVASVGGSREGFGVSLDRRLAAPRPLWVARAVPCAPADDLAVQLIEWPIDVTVHCRWRTRASDPRERREADERTLRQIAALCRVQGHELMVEIDIDGPAGSGGRTVTEALARGYALAIRPDWWLISPQADLRAWEQCAAVINANDGYCRGLLLKLTDVAQRGSVLRAAAAAPLVRGFVAGGSIVGGVASAWLADQLSDAAALARLTERFNALVEAWSAARDPRLDDEPQRSGS